ncbi:AfsR/SARP family transcriptional regulator [Actinacidiphila acididurans]|uniref:AfsR/SARP family transcriptional regulator n=1 Tax=Actinacidiphila acididurans TaxID=2784346 RepID=A0ABS2TVB8_9ACTN|nr:AfsR/SARP family transcriptional regulator [Actinacidiphila acididurans]MBM9506456.1 AfsR/SARP family transcriptional regulator [Actinacidiphila acididurans]
MEFLILGSVQICDERSGVRIAPAGAKQRALLGALVVRAGQVVPADRLVDELWGDRPPAGAANALQAHVARLRRLLPAAPGACRPQHEWLVTRPTGYALRAGCADTDAQRFHHLVAQARQAGADPGRAAQLLRSALALWRGPALEGSGRGTICAAEASLLEESRLAALESLYDACLRAGQCERITGELEELTVAHPLRERFHELLMTALYRCGRQAEALGAYERVRRRLVHDLGVEPGPGLRTRMEAILHHRDPAPARRTPGTPPAPPPGTAAAAGAGAERGRAAAPDGSSAAGAGGGAGAGGEVSVHMLRDEVARLRRRIEALSQEQQDLVTRLERLTARRTTGM